MKSSYLLFLGGVEIQCRPALDSARRFQTIAVPLLVEPKEKIRLLEQLLDFSDHVADEVTLREAHYKRMGREISQLQQQTLREFRLEVQIELAKLKKAAKVEEPKKGK